MMERMIFVTGFARGGTSWLRDCIGSHPDVEVLPRERTVFRDIQDADEIRSYFAEELVDFAPTKLIVNKAPANAPFIGSAAQKFPESKFIFIIRDPRDVFVSHKRGTKKWMEGSNKTVDGCMSKSSLYFSGYQEASNNDNILLVRYEDIHQDFSNTMNKIFDFLQLNSDKSIIRKIFNENSFSSQTSRPNKEDVDHAKRKGVIGDWSIYLNDKEKNWYLNSREWVEFMEKYGYSWTVNNYRNILDAMATASVFFLSENDLLERQLDATCPNVVLQHDVDYLNDQWCYDSVLRTAEIEREYDVPGHYNFLPLDDPRYGKKPKKKVISLIDRIREINPRSEIGLHLNACERFYPAAAPSVTESVNNLDQIIEYLHEQVDAYRQAGVVFRVATAHGYGRGKKAPNNRDTPEMTSELAAEAISLFDTTIRSDLIAKATFACALTDVGGILKPRRIPGGYPVTDKLSYQAMPAGSFLRFLTHPGNYPVDKASTVAMRLVGEV